MVMGLFWALQGAGIIRWPASSFMVDARPWVNYGAITAFAGLMLCWLASRSK